MRAAKFEILSALSFLITLAVFASRTSGAEPDDSDTGLQARFRESVQPFLQTYCNSCHGVDKPKGDFDLRPYSSVEAVAKDFQHWDTVLEKVQSGEMPPPKAKAHPAPELRREFAAWIQALRQREARRTAGDPGPVFARRLSNAEYDNTIRDLTGADIRPAREFPIDPANQAGFDNSSESLAMSPALAKKYLEAARRVSDHLVLKPNGFAFAPHPVIADTDRDKYCVNRILDFYKRQHTDYADYFFAAWRFKNRADLGKPQAAPSDFAAEAGISPKYLATILNTLTGKPEIFGPIAALQIMWRQLPAKDEKLAHAGCEKMRDFVVALREKLVPKVENLKCKGMNDGTQAFVLWKDREIAANRMRCGDSALKLPGWTPDFEDVCQRFCAIFPDAFFITQRGRIYLNPDREKSNAAYRPLSAGFHSMMGYFRDDTPLCELMLDDAAKRELDALWQELDFVTAAPIRQYTGMIWSDRTDSNFLREPQFDFARPEDKDCISEAKIKKLGEEYAAKAQRSGASDAALAAIKDHFARMEASIRWVERARESAEPSHIEALKDFAERAYRRPLSPTERGEIEAFYRLLREKDGLSHEDAVRDTVVSVLMSPHFCYRLDLPARPAAVAGAVRPLSDFALASRLSYFLWSSMPDKELLAHAAAGDLHRPDVLVAQARRMLQDARVRALATEFGGNWLDFRRFEEHNAVDRGRFPTFDNTLREAMFEEPIRFLIDLMQSDVSVLNLLYGDYTFVNPALAAHYGMNVAKLGADEWVRVDGAGKYGRGGLLPMAVFLTKNAPGLRTSPVKRGYWVVRRVLGERIPPPPPSVPVLPDDESKLGELTLRETLAKHREDTNCAACHARFDALGLVFENYGPIGELREKDLGGKAVDTRAAFPGGGEGAGLSGLRDYLRQKRQDDFVDHLCRELFAYGLGRTLLLSDDETINEMRKKLAANEYRFSTLIESIVTSKQFLNRRENVEKAGD